MKMKQENIDSWILNFFWECDLKRLLEIQKNYEKELDLLKRVINAKINYWHEGSINENPEQ